jgi:hypothetical protein
VIVKQLEQAEPRRLGRPIRISGAVLTASYLLFWGFVTFDRWPAIQSMALNNMGDFLGGAFAPLAFLWLVLGFLQQGIELRQNSEALRLQADELKNSVEQQKQMVEFARKDYLAANRAWLYVEAQVSQQHAQDGPEGVRIQFAMSNIGSSPATKVWLAIQPIEHCLGQAAWDIQAKFCDGIRATYLRRLAEDQNDPRLVVFPGHKNESELGAGLDPQKILAGVSVTGNWTHSLIVGCATYQSPVGNEVHQTRFIFEFRQEARVSFVDWRDSAPVRLERYFVGDVAD